MMARMAMNLYPVQYADPYSYHNRRFMEPVREESPIPADERVISRYHQAFHALLTDQDSLGSNDRTHGGSSSQILSPGNDGSGVSPSPTGSQPGNRARQKLLRLSKAQFTELSTDVFDELQRRQGSLPSEPTHLVARDTLHPKRNQARQKLSILSMTRFRDLAADILYEIERRYQLFGDSDQQPGLRESFSSQSSSVQPSALPAEAISPNVSINKPVAKTLHTNNLIPTKSTLVESDDEEEEPEENELSRSSSTNRPQSPENSEISDQPPLQPLRFDPPTVLHSIEEEDTKPFLSQQPRELSGIPSPLPSPEASRNDHNNLQTHDHDEQIRDRDEQIQMLVEEGSRMDDTINAMDTQLAEREAENTSLVKENGQLHELIGELESQKELQLEKHQQEVQQLRQEIEEKDQVIAQHLSDIESMELQHQTLKERHGEALSKQNEFAESSAVLSSEIALLQSQMLENQNTIKTLQVHPSLTTPSSDEYEQKYVDLQRDYAKLQEELEQQEKVTEQVRNEASAFLEEMRALTDNQDAWESTESLSQQVQALKLEVQEWKSRYSRSKAQVRNLRASILVPSSKGMSVFQPTLPVEKGSPYFDDNGKIRDVSMTKFQIAMDEFILKSRTVTARELLDNLHSVVTATRNITQDVHGSELPSNDGADSEQVQSEIAQATAVVSATANHLITSTRNHTMSGGLSPIFILDAAASDLSAAVIDLVKMAKIGPSEGQNDGQKDDQYDELESPPKPAGKSQPRSLEPVNTASYDPAVPLISPVNRTHRIGQTNTVKYDIEDPDNTISELQSFLEEQTVDVVESIQNLLTSIRDNSSHYVIRPIISNIIAVAKRMIYATNNSMKQSRNWQLKDHAAYVVQNLADCCQRMQQLSLDSGPPDPNSSPDRQLKQRLAGISFDMAKCTKELVKIVEEVSLKSEVDQIDQQLDDIM